MEKLFIVLVADYLLLFGMESVLPGMVMSVFNLNSLLIVVLALLVYLGVVPAKEEASGLSQWSNATLVGAGIFMLVITVFSLYKALGWQIALYTLLSLIVAVILYKVLSK